MTSENSSGSRAPRRRVAALFLGILFPPVIGACADPSLALSYRFEPGSAFHYKGTSETKTLVEITGEIEQREEVIRFGIEERVTERLDASSFTIELVVSPSHMSVDGIEIEAPRAASYRISAGPHGGNPAALGEEGANVTSFEARPPLPGEPVRLGKSWDAPLSLGEGGEAAQVAGSGRLIGLRSTSGRRVAQIEILRQGPLRLTESIGRNTYELIGEITTRSRILLDIEEGVVIDSRSRSNSVFDLMEGGTKRGSIRTTAASSVYYVGR